MPLYGGKHVQLTLQSKFNDVQRPLFKQGLVTQGLLGTHMHENDGGFDVVDMQIPFCDEQGSGIQGSVEVVVVVVVVDVVVGAVVVIVTS